MEDVDLPYALGRTVRLFASIFFTNVSRLSICSIEGSEKVLSATGQMLVSRL